MVKVLPERLIAEIECTEWDCVGTILQLHVLIVFILSSVSTNTHPFNNSKKPGRNVTIHSSQLVCSYPGPEGPPGQPGALGPPGIMGRMGAPGKDGVDGKDGEMGEKGERGDAGRPGNPGKPGLQGRMGLIGKAGARGLKGVRGAPGSAGTRGSKGDAGDAGEPGNGGGCNCGSRARSAFTVAVTKSYPKERTPIRFNRVLMNEGGHYNASSGKFVCTFPGIYYFTYDITLANKHLAIGLVHNGQYKIKTFDGNTGNNDVASGSTILRLKRDDQVWLQIFYSEQNGLFFDPYWTDSLFSGFLIYADQDFDMEEQKAGEGSR